MFHRTVPVAECRPTRRAFLAALCVVSAVLVTDGVFAAPPVAEEHETQTQHVETHCRPPVKQRAGQPPRRGGRTPAVRVAASNARPTAVASPLPARHNGCATPLRC